MAERTILGWLLIGLVAGLLARLLPGRDPGGLLLTVLVGIAGALLAGFVARAAGVAVDSGWASYGVPTLCAVALLLLYRLTMARRG